MRGLNFTRFEKSSIIDLSLVTGFLQFLLISDANQERVERGLSFWGQAMRRLSRPLISAMKVQISVV
jgi:hypothetical protein